MNFKKTINVDYPHGNRPIFEEWFSENYHGCNTDRELLPVWFTSFYVNNNYGNDLQKRKELQEYLYSLDINKKWFSVIQYDDAILDDVSHLDLLQFNMSKNYDIPIPLICQPHPYKFTTEKKWLASFVGSRTHPIRNELEKLQGKEGFYISFDYTDIETYCRVLHESVFTFCPRGYGLNSFRISEALQYNSIPVYISDEFIQPFGIDFNEYGILIKRELAPLLLDILPERWGALTVLRQSCLSHVYENYYTYEGCMKQIIKSLETEFDLRK